MKTTLITLLASLYFLAGFSQDPRYQVRSKSSRPVTKVALDEAKLLSDFISGYPSNWISGYVSVEVQVNYNGVVRKALSPNNILTAEQKEILAAAELGADLMIDVIYKYEESSYAETKQMRVSMTVTPEVQAEFVGGQKQLSKYIEENVANKMPEVSHGKFNGGLVSFIINEEGEVVNIKISKTSGDPTTDRLFVEALKKMPKWNPARDAKGVKVKQDFIFNVGNAGAGC